MRLTARQKKEFIAWQETCQQIRDQTENRLPVNETEQEKQVRIKRLQSDLILFANYYFSHFIDSDFAWFHKAAARELKKNPGGIKIFEWPREHAKSVFLIVMSILWEYARGNFSGLMVASNTSDKAKGLLSDLQAQFENNQLFIHDYGDVTASGIWTNGHFTTKDGFGFWALGRGQSPRGLRIGKNRPSHAIGDDLDDKVIVRNLKRVMDAREWVLEDLYGACSIKNSNLWIAGNRIHPKSILAHLVGDTEPKKPKKKGIYHSKIFALENPKTHKKDKLNGVPAWPRYTLEILHKKFTDLGSASAGREYFHEHSVEGITFKHKWIKYGKVLPLSGYEQIILYGDPSWKKTDDSDFKAWVMVGKVRHDTQSQYLPGMLHILYAWVRQASKQAMVEVAYDLFGKFGRHAEYWIEANFNQDQIFGDAFFDEGARRGYQLPLREDRSTKPNKESRIEGLTPLFEKGFVLFNEKERESIDMITLESQFLGFPHDKDDGPDATEGAISKLQKAARGSLAKKYVAGKFKRNRKRI